MIPRTLTTPRTYRRLAAVLLAATATTRKGLPATDATLSLLEPADGRCIWTKLDAAAQERITLSAFDGDCRGGKIALSADGKHGAAWFDPPDESSPAAGTARDGRSRLFVVDLGTGTATSVPLPPGIADLGFDPRGRMIALTLQELSEAEVARGQVLVDGRVVKVEAPGVGVPVLVHALTFEGGEWRRIETAISSTEACDTPGVYALHASQDLAFRSTEELRPLVQGDGENDETLLARLARFAPQAHPGEWQGWIRFGSGATRFVVWEDGADLAISTGLAAFVDAAGNPVRPPAWPFTKQDQVSYRWNGAYLLAAEDGWGSRPRLYRDGKLVWSSDTAQAVTFWPPRQRPEAH